jgi:hypothetical protein
MNIAEALDDPELFGPLFAADTWARRRVFLIVPMCVVRSDDRGRWTCSAATLSAASHRQQHFVKVARAGVDRDLPCCVSRLPALQSERPRHSR